MGSDPIADQFAWVSPYNYAENSPIANIDLWGLQKVSINDVRNSQGAITSRDVTVTVNVKVLNFSSSNSGSFRKTFKNAERAAARSFSTTFGSRVADGQKGLTDGSVPVTVRFDLNIESVSNVSEISNTDFVLMAVDGARNEPGSNVAGWGQLDGNLSMVEASSLTGGNSEVLLHEIGHNLGLEHTSSGSGLMGATMNGERNVSTGVLKNIYQLMPVTGKAFERKFSNTAASISEFLNNNSRSHNEKKATDSGL